MANRFILSVLAAGVSSLLVLSKDPRRIAVPDVRAALVTQINQGPSAGTPPSNTTPPVATGAVKIGQLLSSGDGVWTGDPTITYSYQWRRDGVAIVGATSSTYTVVAADIAAEIDCVVTGTNGFGAASQASNVLTSAWRPAYLIDPSIHIWEHTDGLTASIGAPVGNWNTVNASATLTQAVSSAQPTRAANGVSFITDDQLHADSLASLFASETSVFLGASDVQITGTLQACVWMASTGTSSATLRVVRVQAGGTSNATRWGYYTSSGATGENKTVSLVSDLGADFDQVYRTGGYGDEMRADELEDPLVEIGTDTRGASAPTGTWSWFGVGARRYGSAPSVDGFWEGKIRYLIVSGQTLTNTQCITIRDCAVAAGVL